MSCKKEEKSGIPLQCNENNTEFRQLYETMAGTPNFEDDITMDLETHAFNFEVTTPTTLCKIGYQSLPTFNATPYEIEIMDNTNGTVLYFGSHMFDAASTSYETISPISLQPGVSYTIKRIQTNWNGNIGNTIGRLVHFDNGQGGSITFPVSQGDLTITGSTFYGTGGPLNDWAIPFIDLVFE